MWIDERAAELAEGCAIGSVDECLAQFRRFRDAGAQELVTYGSTPGQNAALARAWASSKYPSSA